MRRALDRLNCSDAAPARRVLGDQLLGGLRRRQSTAFLNGAVYTDISILAVLSHVSLLVAVGVLVGAGVSLCRRSSARRCSTGSSRAIRLREQGTTPWNRTGLSSSRARRARILLCATFTKRANLKPQRRFFCAND